jgi:transposase-like protein
MRYRQMIMASALMSAMGLMASSSTGNARAVDALSEVGAIARGWMVKDRGMSPRDFGASAKCRQLRRRNKIRRARAAR